MFNETRRKYITDPEYRITLTKDKRTITWLFSRSEGELATTFLEGFLGEGKDVKLYRREWIEMPLEREAAND
jgi:hypothetical protein